MSGKSSQRKGRAAELELARFLRDCGFDVRPGEPLNFGKEPDLSGLPGIHIECKRAETLRLSEWMAQAAVDAQRFGDGLPAVFHRRNRQEWLCTMCLTDWLELYRSYQPPGSSNHGGDGYLEAVLPQPVQDLPPRFEPWRGHHGGNAAAEQAERDMGCIGLGGKVWKMRT